MRNPDPRLGTFPTEARPNLAFPNPLFACMGFRVQGPTSPRAGVWIAIAEKLAWRWESVPWVIRSELLFVRHRHAVDPPFWVLRESQFGSKILVWNLPAFAVASCPASNYA